MTLAIFYMNSNICIFLQVCVLEIFKKKANDLQLVPPVSVLVLWMLEDGVQAIAIRTLVVPNGVPNAFIVQVCIVNNTQNYILFRP